MKNLAYPIYLLFLTAILAEVVLHFYDPFRATVSGNKITLPINETIIIRNDVVEKLDKQIIFKTNSLGFRGPEPRDGFKLITVGGSTTQCLFINEEKTWPYLLGKNLNVWVNNAGLDGHSTFGHIILLRDYIVKLKPDVCLFLVGCNDVGRKDLNDFDAKVKESSPLMHSKLLSLINNLRRQHEAAKLDLPHDKHFTLLGNKPLVISDSAMKSFLLSDTALVRHYGERLTEIINLCKQSHIRPVLMTQPSLLGSGKDSATQVDLQTFRVNDHMNGELYWKRLEMYNDETRRVAGCNGVYLIDLAHLLPKNYQYYYDIIHYSNEGCKEVAEIVSERMREK